jgi:selenocysteine lyase/cysteine desulfurase
MAARLRICEKMPSQEEASFYVQRTALSHRANLLLETIRSEFPRASVDATGKQRVFFDNAAGSVILQRALEAENKALGDTTPKSGS